VPQRLHASHSDSQSRADGFGTDGYAPRAEIERASCARGSPHTGKAASTWGCPASAEPIYAGPRCEQIGLQTTCTVFPLAAPRLWVVTADPVQRNVAPIARGERDERLFLVRLFASYDWTRQRSAGLRPHHMQGGLKPGLRTIAPDSTTCAAC